MFTRKFLFVATILFLTSFTYLPTSAVAQSVPGFQMQLSNGRIFSAKNLSPQKPTILIYFAPDCEHCQILMDELFKKIGSFKKAQIVMVTFENSHEVIGFERLHQTERFSNIKVGTEIPTFFLRNYYKLQRTPFTALFDKRGKMVVSYKDQTPVNDLIRHLNNLK